jgi:DNA/RNA-binding domain of Phe-tRNA-synthetase-like protein
VRLRLSAEGEKFEGRVSALPEGTIVVADEERPLGILFDRAAEGRGAGRGTRRVLLVAIGVRGVPDIAMEEALWVAGSALRA